MRVLTWGNHLNRRKLMKVCKSCSHYLTHIPLTLNFHHIRLIFYYLILNFENMFRTHIITSCMNKHRKMCYDKYGLTGRTIRCINIYNLWILDLKTYILYSLKKKSTIIYNLNVKIDMILNLYFKKHYISRNKHILILCIVFLCTLDVTYNYIHEYIH